MSVSAADGGGSNGPVESWDDVPPEVQQDVKESIVMSLHSIVQQEQSKMLNLNQ